jgi:hypothetical protein
MEQSSFMFQVMFPRPEYEECGSELAEDWLQEERKERKISDTKAEKDAIGLHNSRHIVNSFK